MPKNERLSRGWLKIGELARKMGVPVTTIRYYTEIGLLAVVAETQGGYRLYDYEDVVGRFSTLKQIRIENPTLKQAKALIEENYDADNLSVA